ncbi:MAG: DJ-1/PfpI family protein [Kineosporiaceae bacterium]
MARDPRTVAVLLGRGVAVLEAAVPARVFTAVTSSRHGYEVLPIAAEPRPIVSTAGLVLDPPHDLDAAARAGTLVVPGWREGGDPPAPDLLEALRAAHAEGATVAGLCLGAFVLAEAGLLDGLSATTHWSAAAALAARYPRVSVLPDTLYVDEGRVLTSAGSAASIDACLHLVRRRHGAAVASAVARELVVGAHRPGGDPQALDAPVADDSPGGAGSGIPAAVAHALAHLDDPGLDVDALAAVACVSRRSFDRHFRRTTGVSATRWLLRQRVHRAARLLEETDLPVDAVARRVGMASAAVLRPHFRAELDAAPAQWRERHRAGGPQAPEDQWGSEPDRSGEAIQTAVSP